MIWYQGLSKNDDGYCGHIRVTHLSYIDFGKIINFTYFNDHFPLGDLLKNKWRNSNTPCFIGALNITSSSYMFS